MYAHEEAAAKEHGSPQQMCPTQPFGGIAAAWVYDLVYKMGGLKSEE